MRSKAKEGDKAKEKGNNIKREVGMHTIGVEPITSSLPWNCSTIGAMQAKYVKIKSEVIKR